MTEPFPPLNGAVPANIGGGIARRRRKSSGLGADLPGDVDVPSFATSRRVDAMADNMKSPVDARSDKPRRSKRRTVRRGLSKFKRACVRHTWLLPLLLLLAIVAAYLAYPHPSNPLSACLFLSYPLPRNDPLIPAAVRADPNAPTHYGKGGRDFAFVGFYIIVLSFTREFCMQRLIRPIAIACGIKGRAKQSRFMEQAYTALYFGLYGPFGIWVMSRSPVWYFDTTEGMYAGFPHRTHEAVFKAYYLLQASYWAQQAIVLLLMLEKPRKDFKELVAHHIITLALIWLSYRFHFTYMGIAVYITHDVSDFFLATSKILNYIDSPIVGPYFFVFMCVWGYLRHFINIKILYSILTSFRTVGPFDLNWETQQYKCWISQYITFALLAALQAVNLFWWFFICRIAYRFIVYKDADDDRSEYEPSEGEEAERKHEIQNANAESELVNAGSESPNGNGVKRSISNVDAPSTPVQTNAAKEPETIGSRVKQRKKGGQS